MADGEQILGLSAEAAQTAKVMAAGGFGAAVAALLRHPGTLLRAGAQLGCGMGIAAIFTDTVAPRVGLAPYPTAALLGLLGWRIAWRLLKAVDSFDALKAFGPK